MATPQTEIESKVLELATESLEAFCEDISGMFGVEMECTVGEISAESVAQLDERFEGLVAVNIIDAEGALNGTFQLILDQEGLFTLGGVMVMLPEKRILANRKDASADLAESMVDAVGEAGNLLVGAWERIFREELEGHGHLLQRLPAFVGKPWDDPEEKIGLGADDELTYIPYEMSIAPYPAFECGVILSRAIFEDKSEDSENADRAEDEASEHAEAEALHRTSDDADGEAVAEEAEPVQPAAKRTPASKAPEGETSASYTPDDETAAAETPTAEVYAAEAEAADEGEQAPGPEAAEEEVASQEPAESPGNESPLWWLGRAEQPAEKAAGGILWPDEPSEEPELGPISEAIKEMTGSSELDAETEAATEREVATGGATELLWMCARDVMQEQVVWADPDDSVRQALTKLQQNDIGYLLVGRQEVLEGIVSKADVAGAMSPYLRPILGKWRRPTDDATLQIRLKWIMSRPVRMARPDTPLATILENMCRFGGRVLPVVDEQGEVHGLVTAFDIFQKLLDVGANVPTAGKAPQGPPL